MNLVNFTAQFRNLGLKGDASTCGLPPQAVIATVKPEIRITHYPGSMLATDRKNTEFAIM